MNSQSFSEDEDYNQRNNRGRNQESKSKGAEVRNARNRSRKKPSQQQSEEESEGENHIQVRPIQSNDGNQQRNQGRGQGPEEDESFEMQDNSESNRNTAAKKRIQKANSDFNNGNTSGQRNRNGLSLNRSGMSGENAADGTVQNVASNNLNKSNLNKSVMNQSQNRRKEKKNLQKYDSNSIDEEEFQDYFSNPQKRKEFDRQRLQQQMREIQNIAGFSLGQFGNKSMKSMRDAFPAYPGGDIDVGGGNTQQKNYATVSLCCLSVTNPFRNKIIQLVAINNWFDKIILCVILVNCMFLAMDNDVQFISKHSALIDFVFLIIYTIEMVLKIIAQGFFMRAHSYLRDTWNILDFVVVILGWLSQYLAEQNISAIRVIRILRPLRTINSMPGMSGLVSTILNSLPIMFDIMVLFGFMLVMFGTIATQVLGGALQYRCQAVNEMGNMSELLGEEGITLFCQTDADCIAEQPPKVNSKCLFFGNPIQGTFGFDNILLSIMNIFQVITLEGWTGMMYIVRDAKRSTSFDIFFVSCVLFGAFFVLNLMIAVQFTYLGEAFDEEDRRQKEIQKKINNKMKLKRDLEDEDSFFDEEEDSQNEQNNSNGSQRRTSGGKNEAGRRQSTKKKGFCKFKKSKTLVKWSKKVENVVNADYFVKMIILFIIINTCFLASEQYQQPQWLTDISEIANYCFTFIFALEMFLKLFGLGIKQYMQDNFNIFDSVIVILSLVELFQSDDKSGLSVLRAFRLLRIFKIIKSWTTLKVLLSTVIRSFSAITNLGVLTLLYLFITSLLAKQFFSDKLLREDGSESRYSFKRTGPSLITIYIVLTGENWNEIMVEVMTQQKQKTLPAMFFITLMIIGNYMLLNLFLAILLKFISEKGASDDADDTTRIETPKQLSAENQDGKAIADDQLSKNGAKKNDAIPIDQDDSAPLNSSNSNIEEEFEQIKMQLQQLSNMNMQQLQRGMSNNQQYEGGSENSIDLSQESQKQQQTSNQKNAQMKEGKLTKIPTINHAQLKSMASRSVKTISKRGQKKQIEIDENSNSLFIFAPDNCLRMFLKGIIENPYFEGFIYHMIAFNSLLLMLDQPILKDEYQAKSIQDMLFIISMIFIGECLIKIIVMGFFIGEKSYLRDSWNVLDFTIVFFSVMTIVLDAIASVDVGFMRGFRALRALRPLRVVSKNEGIKTVVNSLLQSIPSLLNVLLIILLFLLVFGILGVQLFKGNIATCNDEDPEIKVKADCVGSFWVDVTDLYGEKIGMKLEEREWIIPFNNYNNVFISMITFFEISTLEMWPDNMYAAIDSNGVDKVPIKDNNLMISLIYIVFIFLTTFFIMNLFISVIVDKFNEEIKKRQGAHNFTEEQKEWVKIQRLLVHTNPKIIPVEPINCFRLQCFKVVQSTAFEYVIMSAIVINTLFLCIDYYGKPDELSQILDTANQTFVVIFTIEMVLKITAHGFKYYWHVNWNKFDFIIVIMSLIAIDETLVKELNFNVTALRIIRVSRLLRMVKTSEGLRSLLKTLYMSLGNIMTTASLLTLILFTFTVAGMSLFGTIDYEQNDFINKDANFSSFYLSMMTLWRACTGESWNGLMHDCFKEQGILAIFFWVTFQLTTFLIFMNVFIAVIYENFNDIQASEDENDILSLKKKDIKAFQNTWAKYNPMGENYMRTLRLPEFLRELPPPLGYQGIRIEESKLNKIIFCLNIKDHCGRVYYPEVMWTIFHSIVGINDVKVNNCEQIINILKIVKRKYKGLGRKVNLDSLCGNKYYRNELTAIKYIQAMKILTKWKNYKDNKIREKEQKLMKKLTTGGGNHDGQHDNESNNAAQKKKKITPKSIAEESFKSEEKESEQEYSNWQDNSNQQNSRKAQEDSINNSSRVDGKKRVARKKRYNPNKPEVEEQQRAAESSEEMDDEPVGFTERDPTSSRNRNIHLQNNNSQGNGQQRRGKSSRNEQDSEYTDHNQVKVNFRR